MKPRIPEVVKSPVTIEAHKDYVVAIFQVGESTVGVRFASPEQVGELFSRIMDKVAQVWPEHELVRIWLEDDPK